MPSLSGDITPGEIEFLRQLSLIGARFMLVGMTAAILQGADTSTRDIDLWVSGRSGERLAEAAKVVGGFYVWRANPPFLEGAELARIDLVSHMSGLARFEEEYRDAIDCRIGDFSIKLLPLERIIESKRVADRAKDRAALPALLAILAAKIRY